ncbi:MAG: GTPase HflX, partial [Lentisphaerae bacterium]|nr:GTPase HflX [Lentisphaerota bacterium]
VPPLPRVVETAGRENPQGIAAAVVSPPDANLPPPESMKHAEGTATERVERALLVQVVTGRTPRGAAADSLGELERLADTAGAVVVGRITQRREGPTAGLYVGEGKLADIQVACRRGRANLVIFDNDLSAVQVNNLDLALGIKVIDRTELILQIFARRARSAEAKIQVELAQLQYLVSRIPVSVRQQRFQGGIGMRGPGESPLQLRNEPMRRRIRDLQARLEQVRRRRERTRRRRTWPFVCLTGYTNAGKSTLLNALSEGGAYVDDRLFATLDTKTRRVNLGGGRRALVTDTVGFIRHLPHGLVASFRSTLDVAAEADLLLIVADASDAALDDHLRVVAGTLEEIGAERVPALLLLNKCDALEARAAAARAAAFPDAVRVSALRRRGLDTLKARIAATLLEQGCRFPPAGPPPAARRRDGEAGC